MSGKKVNWRRYMQRRKSILVWLVVACAVMMSFAAATAAKYVLRWSPGVAQADATIFYFSSDLLTSGDTPVYQLSNFVPGDADGSSRITFSLNNYVDELRVSKTDIAYTITTNNDKIASINGTISQNGTEGVGQPISITVPVECFSEGKAIIRVTATSASPYAKTIAAVFELYQSLQSVDYSVHDAAGNNTVSFVITTHDKAGTVTITPPENVYPDRTDSRLSFDGNVCHFNANTNAQYNFVFFKNDPTQVWTNADFEVN